MSLDILINDILVSRQVSRLNFASGGRIDLNGADLAPTKGQANITVASDVAGRLIPVATWPASASLTLGTSYVDVFTAAGEAGLAVDVDFLLGPSMGTIGRLLIWWNGLITAGTHTAQLIDALTPSNILFETTGLSTGRNLSDFSLPVWATGVKQVKIQTKSTAADDTAILRGAVLYLAI